MLAINLKKISVLFAVLYLSLVGYDTCRLANATDQSIQLVVSGCNA